MCIDINIKYKLDPLKSKIKNIIKSKLLLTHKNNYNFSFCTQIYSIDIILTKIFYCLYVSKNWRGLGCGWNNIYKHYIKINQLKLFKTTYVQMLNTYLTKHKTSLKIVSIDTSFIYNKYGTDNIARNKFAKNKNCSKLFLMVNKKGKPIHFDIYAGNINDSKLLSMNINKLINICKNNCKYFLADTGFCSKINRGIFIEHNIKPLIPKNIRNSKKYENIKILDWNEKIKIMMEEFTKMEKNIYKSRIMIENVFSKIKQIYRFNMRYDKKNNNLKGFMYLHFSTLLN